MAGNTATINFETLKLQWASHSSMFAICSCWTITKDQLIRLRDVVPLPKRHDRRFRFKPKGRPVDPSPRAIAQACREIQARWDDSTRDMRSVTKREGVTLRIVPIPDGVDLPPED